MVKLRSAEMKKEVNKQYVTTFFELMRLHPNVNDLAKKHVELIVGQMSIFEFSKIYSDYLTFQATAQFGVFGDEYKAVSLVLNGYSRYFAESPVGKKGAPI